MPLPYQEIVSSKTFTFLIGEEKHPMYVHNVLASRSSETLSILIDGNMAEAWKGVAELSDVEVHVFARFTQWLYTGTYDHQSTHLDRSPSIMLWGNMKGRQGENNLLDTPQEAARQHPSAFYAANSSKKQILWAIFTGGSSAELPKERAKIGQLEQAAKSDVSEYETLYLVHAKVYCFADKYGVLALQQVAVDKLKQNLIDHTDMSDGRTDAIIDLIMYTMEHTTVPDGENMDKLSDIVLQYTVIILELLFANETFKKNLVSNSELSIELMGRVITSGLNID